MLKLKVNNLEVEVPEGSTVLQACEKVGVEIPKFCYHEKLAIAGNCRMCLVEMEKVPKPVASCAQPAAEGMVIYTNTPMVKKAREGVMEFLLINHPLDCPICDQGGECDLQDEAMKYGKSNSRFHEEKRAVEDKYMGPLIKTHMTRCIHCTRCVRFIEDIAGTYELGAVGRGNDMQITTYIEKSISSELSGNVIDLCPVGALTSKPYEFKARSWELHKTESIDVLDAVCSNIRIDSIGNEVMRILPRQKEDLNEEWISDKTRFAYDGLKYQRLDKPMVSINGKLEPVSWSKAYEEVKEKISKTKSKKIGAIAGDLTDVETMFAMKSFLDSIGCNNYDVRQEGSYLDNSHRADYIFNTTIQGIEKADSCLIFGSNPRHEATILNARIRKAYINKGLKVALIGEKTDLTYPYKHLGDNPWTLKQIADGNHPYCKILEKSEYPMIIIGASVYEREDYEATLHYSKKIANQYKFIKDEWNGYNLLQKSASRVGAFDIGFISNDKKISTNVILEESDLLVLLGADEIDLSKIKKDAFVVYIGHHGDKSAYRANVILPGAAYTEKNATYVNLEGRVQQTESAISPPGEAKVDWIIIKELSDLVGKKLPFSNLEAMRQAIENYNDIFAEKEIRFEKFVSVIGRKKEFTSDTLQNSIKNYYMSDSISRHSQVMAQCSKVNG